MRLQRDRAMIGFLALIAVVLPSYGISKEGPRISPETRRAVTVQDGVEMQSLPWGEVGHFSPDGRTVVVVTEKGNVRRRTNEFRLLKWDVDTLVSTKAPENLSPDALLVMGSTSNRPAIDAQSLTWVNNETLMFLGEQPGQEQQVYSFNVRRRSLRRLTNHPTSVMSYGADPQQKRIAYVAEEPYYSIFAGPPSKDTFEVTGEWLYDVVQGRSGGYWGKPQLFLLSGGHSRQLSVPDMIPRWSTTPSLSPDGRFVVVRTRAGDIPPAWSEYKGGTEYENHRLHLFMTEHRAYGQPSLLCRYSIVDTVTGAYRILLDAPIGDTGSEALWSPSGHNVVLSNVYLPLGSTKGEERIERSQNTFTVELNVDTGSVVKITSGDVRLLKWDRENDSLVLRVGRTLPTGGDLQVFKKTDSGWAPVAKSRGNTKPEIIVKQSMNDPPVLALSDSSSQASKILLDLNPQFRQLRFAKEEIVAWKGTDGHDVKGGLYYPPDYVRGGRYPLVIQTHGFLPDRFCIDGPFPSGFAAQALAAKGIMVLQVEEGFDDFDTPKEVDRETSSLLGAVDFLDAKGLIDRNRVGLIGFSRTGIYVKRALVASHYSFAAASVFDDSDAGYIQWISGTNFYPNYNYIEDLNGGALPFGTGIAKWIERAPSFQMEKVKTPLRIAASNPGDVLWEWEWFAGLTRLEKPVELIVLRDASHVVEKPQDKLALQQGNVDWFAFWLKGEEDPNPAKADQYKRWRELRKQQEQEGNKTAAD